MGGNSIYVNSGVTGQAVQQIMPTADIQQQNDSLDSTLAQSYSDESATNNGKPITLEHQMLEASYEYDQHLRQIIIKFKNSDSGEVVRQLPPEQVVRMLTNIVTTIEKDLDVKG